MTTKIKKIPLKTIVVITAFLFACGSGSQPPTLKIIQAEHTTSETTVETIRKRMVATETNAEENNDKTAETATGSNSKFRPKAMPAGRVDVPPLLNEKPWYEELNNKYIFENNNFRKIVDEAGITGYWDVGCMFFIDEDGFVDTSEQMPTAGLFLRIKRGEAHIEAKTAPPEYQLISNEFLRIINSTQGKWTRAIHDGEPMKVRINSGFSSDQLE